MRGKISVFTVLVIPRISESFHESQMGIILGSSIKSMLFKINKTRVSQL
jgi:hypothetical protein